MLLFLIVHSSVTLVFRAVREPELFSPARLGNLISRPGPARLFFVPACFADHFFSISGVQT